MSEQVALWDIDETLTDYKAIKSTDWKWNMATDYPAKNGTYCVLVLCVRRR